MPTLMSVWVYRLNYQNITRTPLIATMSTKCYYSRRNRLNFEFLNTIFSDVNLIDWKPAVKRYV